MMWLVVGLSFDHASSLTVGRLPIYRRSAFTVLFIIGVQNAPPTVQEDVSSFGSGLLR
jgi:hypothetical protein